MTSNSARVALVPLEAWAYHAPLVRATGAAIDIGLLGEALIYYERVYVVPGNEAHFADLVEWFRRQRHLGTLVALISEGTVTPYYYAFLSSAVHHQERDVYSVVNIQDQASAAGPVFISRVVQSPRLRNLHPRHLRRQLEQVLQDQHIEVKAADFGVAIENAKFDYGSPERSAALVQVFVDEVYRELGYLRPPQVTAVFGERADGARTITYNIDFGRVAELLGKELGFHRGTPLVGAVVGNRTLWSAANLGADLYLAPPLTSFVRYKLDDGWRTTRRKQILADLVARVAFPDVRRLLNQGRIGFSEVLALRARAGRFRQWLAEESEFERDAVVAYHAEVAEQAGFTKSASRVLSVSGTIGGAALGAALVGPIGAVGGAATGAALEYLAGLGGKMLGGWRPRIFGDWAAARIDEAMRGVSLEDDRG